MHTMKVHEFMKVHETYPAPRAAASPGRFRCSGWRACTWRGSWIRLNTTRHTHAVFHSTHTPQRLYTPASLSAETDKHTQYIWIKHRFKQKSTESTAFYETQFALPVHWSLCRSQWVRCKTGGDRNSRQWACRTEKPESSVLFPLEGSSDLVLRPAGGASIAPD